MKRSMTCVLWVVILLAIAGGFFLGRPGSTPPIRDQHGHLIPDSIASLEKISIGGMEQWILVRGKNVSNPIENNTDISTPTEIVGFAL